jgi:hypothetical protein
MDAAVGEQPNDQLKAGTMVKVTAPRLGVATGSLRTSGFFKTIFLLLNTSDKK